MWQYMHSYGNDGCDGIIPKDRMSHYLRFWNENKAHIFEMFEKQFIVSKPIMFEASFDELWDQMNHKLRYETNASLLLSRISAIIDNTFIGQEDRWQVYDMFNIDTLVRNEIKFDKPTVTLPGSLFKSGKPMVINNGAKAAKTICKIAKEMGENENDIENFRQAHSQALNQKRIKGTLCLSIHPMDYITMSDNNLGWGSCMSWTEEDSSGDYRIGTVEMMNSPYAVVAYIKDEKDADFWNATWNNKKWRQLIMITPEMIIGNRQYPYENDEIQTNALTWMKELASKSLNYGPYQDHPVIVRNCEDNTFQDTKIFIRLWFDLMYNDLYDNRLAFISESIKEHSNYEINYSGPAVCISCGEEITYCNDTRSLCGPCCSNEVKCECCGEYIYRHNAYFDICGNAYCDYCWNEEMEVCDRCGNHESDMYDVYINLRGDSKVAEAFNWHAKFRICYRCIEDGESPWTGKIYREEDPLPWMYPKYFVYLDEVKDEALCEERFNDTTYNFLRAVRDANNDEERAKLVDEWNEF